MEGFAIWGAISGAISTINTVKCWLTELRTFITEAQEAGETLQNFCDDYIACEADLELWAEMWGIEENVSKKYLLKLWGRSGSKAIAARLESIYRTHGDIKAILTLFLQDAGMLVSLDLKKHQDAKANSMSRNTLAAESRRKVSEKQKGLTIKKTVAFVSSKAPDIFRKLAHIQKQTTDMKTLSKSAFQNKNQIPISGDFLPKDKLEEIKTSILFQLAYETRMASRGLYQSCYAASKKPILKDYIKDIKLEMDLFRRGVADTTTVASREAMALQFRLLVAWPARLLEVFVEGPFCPDRDPKLYNAAGDGFYGACMKALDNDSETFQVSSVAEATWFRSYVPPERRRKTWQKSPQNPFEKEDQLKPLVSLLYDLNTTRTGEPADKFRRSERIRLAFKIVECGLFLSGTSWLADLKSVNIQRSARDQEQNRRFLLDTAASKADYDDDHFRQFVQHAFAIGVLLTEIGTGRLVAKVLPRSKTEGQCFSLYKTRTSPPSDPEELSGAQIFQLLAMAIGELGYAQPVKICLESKESWRQAINHTAEKRGEIYQGILAEYYLEVYSP
jgi:hypothetical protein